MKVVISQVGPNILLPGAPQSPFVRCCCVRTASDFDEVGAPCFIAKLCHAVVSVVESVISSSVMTNRGPDFLYAFKSTKHTADASITIQHAADD